MTKKKDKKATGTFRVMIGSITLTKNGKTETLLDVDVHKKLVNGEWVDVPPAREVIRKVIRKAK